MEEKDFYNKDETKKFLLFKLFFQKCYLLFKDNINEGEYYLNSIKIKYKILNDLFSNDVPFYIINDLIKEEDIFYNKILVITDNNKIKADQYLNRFKENMMRCKLIFIDLDINNNKLNLIFCSKGGNIDLYVIL